MAARCAGSHGRIASCSSTTVLKAGKTAATSKPPNATAVAASNRDSPMNCATRPLLCAPITLRTPTSLARCPLRAVARFIKLIHAMSRMIQAITVNKRTVPIRPPTGLPSSKALRNRQSFMAWRKGVAPPLGSLARMYPAKRLLKATGSTPGFSSTYVRLLLISQD